MIGFSFGSGFGMRTSKPGNTVPPAPEPDPVISVSSGPGFAGSVYTVANGGAGNWQANGASLLGETAATLLMTLALEGTVIRWRRNDGKSSNTIQMRRPQDIANLVALFDIRQGVAQAGSAVSAWNSQVGGVVGAQPTGSRQPTFGATAFDGAPGLTYTATQALNGLALNSGPDARTYIGGVIFTDPAISCVVDGTANSNYQLRRANGRVIQVVRRNVNIAFTTTQTIADGAPTILAVRHGNGVWNVSANGTEIGSGALAVPNFSTGGTLSMSSESNSLKGVETSHAIFDAYVDNTDTAMVQGWIAHTLGKAALLPANHPFKEPSSMRIAA